MTPKLLCLLAVPFGLAACGDVPLGTAKPVEASPAALAALPPGVDPGFLIRDDKGCYGIVIEVPQAGEPQSGPALLDAAGQQVCDA